MPCFVSDHETWEPIGEIALDQIAWRSGEAELKISIDDARLHNHGYGTQAILSLLEQAFGKMNLKRIYLRVHARNAIALRCYEKAGFKKKRAACSGAPNKAFVK